MSYEIRFALGGDRVAGPFSVLDTAINRAVEMTRPPPAPPKPHTHVARTLGTTDADPYGLFGPPKPPMLSVIVVEVEGYGNARVRAFVDGGRLTWALDCKACAYAREHARGRTSYCIPCDSTGAVRDAS